MAAGRPGHPDRTGPVGRGWFVWLAIPALVGCAGCGNARSQPAGLGALGPPQSLVNFGAAGGDVNFGHPSTWSVTTGPAPEVARISSAGAVATVYAYPRTDLSLTRAGAAASQQRLLRSLAQRDPSFHVDSTRLRKVDGAEAVEIVGRGKIAGHRVRSQSVHVYKGAAEYVIDAYSKPGLFRRAEAEAFDPMLATMTLGGFPAGPVPAGGVTAPG
jgi:hypothetical protein